MEYHPSYLIGVMLFNRGDFFEAHEHWEDVWNDTVGVERDFYKGLIQTAVGLCHVFNGNARGARRLFYSSRSLLNKFGSTHCGLDLEQFAVDVDRCFAPVVDDPQKDWLTAEETGELAIGIHLNPTPQSWPSVEPSSGE